MTRPALAVLAAAALPLALGGCVTLFPKETPTTLYRFDATVPAAQTAAAPFTVRLGAPGFDSASAGDAIMTSDGDRVAYIAGARWSAPAQELFDAAVEHGFDEAGGPAHPIAPGAAARADLRLQLEVTRFEADYLAGPAVAPTVVVRVRAQLAREKDMTVVAEREFDATAPAADNRVSAIVPAFDAATSKVVGDLVAWVNGGGG
jgi:cholesterol transport system auxiliary component